MIPQPKFTPTNNLFGSKTETLTRGKEEIRDEVQKELDDKIYELPGELLNLELGDALANILGAEAEDILDKNFVNKKKLEDEALENIKEEYGFKEIKDPIDEASVPHQLDFFYCGSNENFVQTCKFLSLNNENREFIAFLISDTGQNIMTNNSLSITLNLNILSTRISTQMKIFIAFFYLNRTKKREKSQNVSHAIIALKNMSKNICLPFQ